MSYFPMFVELKGAPCLIAGGGRIALRKVEALLDFGAEITVVAGDILEEIQSLPGLVCKKRAFEEEDIAGKSLVVAATDDKGLNHKIAKACIARKIPVNAVDQIEDCSFIFPAYLKRGEVVSAFSSGGQSPVITQYLKKEAELIMTDHLGNLAACLGNLRERARESIETERERKEFYRELLQFGLEKSEIPSEEEIEEIFVKYGRK